MTKKQVHIRLNALDRDMGRAGQCCMWKISFASHPTCSPEKIQAMFRKIGHAVKLKQSGRIVKVLIPHHPDPVQDSDLTPRQVWKVVMFHQRSPGNM